MKKINKKGFTLVELLGVIVILIMILSLVLPKIISRTKSKNEAVATVKDDIVIKAAKLYLDETVEPENDNTYCVSIDDLVNKEYLLQDSDYQEKYVKAIYNDGYSYSISSTCTPSSPTLNRCDDEELCTACYVSRTYNSGLYEYDAKVITGIPNENSELLGSEITYVQNEESCIKSAAIFSAHDYYDEYTYMFKKRTGNVYCLSLNTLLSQNRISQSLYNFLNQLGYTKVRISYNSSTNNFDYEVVNSCTPNIYSICTAISNDEYGSTPTTNYASGETYDCAVNSSNTYRFYILSSDDKTVTLVTKNSLDNGYWSDRVGGLSDPQATRGPNLAFTNLQSITSNWSNIDNIVIDYDDEVWSYGGNNRGGNYGGIKTTIDGASGNYTTRIYKSDNSTVTATYTNLKARLMTRLEMYSNGCSRSQPSELSNASIYRCTEENYCSDCKYWLISDETWLLDTYSNSDALSYGTHLYNNHTYYVIRDTQVNTSHIGYRPVIVVSKYDLSINGGDY